ncbi:hypothetical protein BpHYR1_020429 [Brachionus plicatilis]|uniref:Uncharacterized protein n=1 Tax=Brachionus plicatilis TaxID=10195 RepID=A0A3M7SEB8_BRAPC|nr:hypothetical protein BpHYR1_020429 [Brachionus plicatilis]
MLHSTGLDSLLNAFFAANLAASDDSTRTKAISLASSGPIERTFAYAGYINTPHRSRMTLQSLLVLNSILFITFEWYLIKSLCKMLNNAKYMLNIV